MGGGSQVAKVATSSQQVNAGTEKRRANASATATRVARASGSISAVEYLTSVFPRHTCSVVTVREKERRAKLLPVARSAMGRDAAWVPARKRSDSRRPSSCSSPGATSKRATGSACPIRNEPVFNKRQNCDSSDSKQQQQSLRARLRAVECPRLSRVPSAGRKRSRKARAAVPWRR